MTGSPNTLAVGTQAEEEACRFLESKGLRLMTRNFRCTRGEIDLIMRDKQDIVFVEVRVRNNPHYGHAIETVDRRKQLKIIKAATYYLYKQKWLDKVNCRFDVIGISYVKTKASLEWIQDAFPADRF